MPTPTYQHLTTASGLAAGQAAGYTVFAGGGSAPYQARSVSGVVEIGHGFYEALVTLPADTPYAVLWDDTLGAYSLDKLPAGYAGADVRAVTGVPYFAFDGVIAAATSSTITLPAAASDGSSIPDDGSFAGKGLYIYSGAGLDQYVVLGLPTTTPPNSRVYFSGPPTKGVPLDGTSHYLVVGNIFSTGGVIAAATATTVTLPATDSLGVEIPDDGRLRNAGLFIESGRGAGQFVLLTDPTGTPREYGVIPGTMPVPLSSDSHYLLNGTMTTRPDLSQELLAPRLLDRVADAALTVSDAFHCAVAAAAGKETEIDTSFTVMTPAGTVIRYFTLDSSTEPTSRS